MAVLLGWVDLYAPLRNGQRGYEVVQRMIEREMHQHGQMKAILTSILSHAKLKQLLKRFNRRNRP
jgi:hypothetical protein